MKRQYLSGLLFFAYCTYSAQPKSPEKLPDPFATKSTRNVCEVKGWKNGEAPVAPVGFKVRSFGSNLVHPRWLYVLPNGDVLVAETKKEPKGAEKAYKVATGRETIKTDEGHRII